MDLLKGNLIVFITFCLLVGCGSGGSQLRDRLGEIDRLAEREPEQAIAALDSIKGVGMSNADSHYYDLLTIKAKDKAYVTHTSDSLILDVIKYYDSNPDDVLTIESLYYGGRVYSDIGDYPTALSYYHMALDLLPETTELQSHRACVLAQTGILLDKLRLYDEAIPYIEKVIEYNVSTKDVINEVRDIRQLGIIYLRAGNYIKAKHYINKASDKAKDMDVSERATMKMLQSAVSLRLGNQEEALELIRDVVDSVPSISKNTAYALASEIYLKNGIRDTAYIYAQKLVKSADFSNKKSGYKTILSPEFRSYIADDTLYRYIDEYSEILEKFYDENNIQQADIQHSLYNYQLHERARIKAEKSEAQMFRNVIIMFVIGLLILIAYLFMRIRYKNNLIQLHAALSNIQTLKERLEQAEERESSSDEASDIQIITEESDDTQTIRQRLRSELLDLYESGKNKNTIALPILQSEPYKKIKEHIEKEKSIGEESVLWGQLKNIITECYPDFETNLQLLTCGRLTKQEYRTAMLIKVGVTPSQMNTLLARSKGTISSRREAICVKVFDQKMGTKIIDGIIRLL